MSKKIGLFFGTQTGNTEMIAETIQAAIGKSIVDLLDILPRLKQVGFLRLTT